MEVLTLTIWLLERRKRAESALVTVVADCYLAGVSTRRMDKPVKQLGIHSLSKSQVSRMATDLDTLVADFRQPHGVGRCRRRKRAPRRGHRGAPRPGPRCTARDPRRLPCGAAATPERPAAAMPGRRETWAIAQIDRCVAGPAALPDATHLDTDARSLDEVAKTVAAAGGIELFRPRASRTGRVGNTIRTSAAVLR